MAVKLFSRRCNLSLFGLDFVFAFLKISEAIESRLSSVGRMNKVVLRFLGFLGLSSGGWMNKVVLVLGLLGVAMNRFTNS